MKTSAKKVLNLVSKQLRQVHLDGITLDVLNGEIEKREDFWYIPVRPSAQPPSMHQYYEVLVDVETELSQKHHVNVWLVPTVPD
jgi:hypothetical protein